MYLVIVDGDKNICYILNSKEDCAKYINDDNFVMMRKLSSSEEASVGKYKSFDDQFELKKTLMKAINPFIEEIVFCDIIQSTGCFIRG